MSEHYVIAADNGHLRIYQERRDPEQMNPALDLVQALDFPSGVKSYTDEEADMAGRFQGSNQQGRGPGAPTARMGMSVDERLPLQREVDRKRVRDLGQAIDAFLLAKKDATWDFAAAPALHNAMLDALNPAVRGRLQKAVAKDLVHQPPQGLRSHFE